MSEEERELLARIGQLAGQINRHKTHQAGAAPFHQHYTGNRRSTPGNPGWVSRIDRHRQLINANVYEKDTQSRVKAIEETRQKKLQSRKDREKSRFNDYLRNRAGVADATTNPNPTTSRNELMIEGIRFIVADGGKKLVKSSVPTSADDRHSATPKMAIVAGVKFHRTKTGNLVANRIVQTQRLSGNGKKVLQPCKIFSTTGSCPKGPSCRYQHDPNRVAICRDFLKDGKCSSGESCDLSHETTPERMPDCVHYAKGHCTNPDCLYTHSKAAPSALVCEAFGFYGFCDQGADCAERHVYECPDFSNTGTCKTKGCKLLHRERASLLRHQGVKAGDDMDEDVSSDEEVIDSDDVDSDDVAEYIEAESDDSDFEHAKDFIPL
ncbi:hypothetical protein E4U42_002690 [Claviceps africana]|uniref:C3H1-type domain-containing protein n=1 Tax=Claviceps africana TaxID=83212 RepID=A0A8K0J7X9_9HYPO|nr:hypothetical protein E4U42_002690 [Claviceps africana]